MDEGNDREPARSEARRFISLLPDVGHEPSAGLGESEAAATWAVASAPWHPALLARSDRLPAREDPGEPTPPQLGEVRLITPVASARLVSGFRTQCDDLGVRLIEGSADRPGLVRDALNILGPTEGRGAEFDDLALDFLALGTARWLLRDLTEAMGHADLLDVESLAREAINGARAWVAGDLNEAKNRLRAAFELLTQAREKFYPVEPYLVDLLLLDTTTPTGSLADQFQARTPFSLIAPAAALEAFAVTDPDAVPSLLAAVDEGWADLIGGPYQEADEPLLPVESILWQYRHGAEVYRRHMDGRSVETHARRRFGHYPLLPQVARRFGLRFGLPMSFDAGKFPIPPDSKRLWESPDGSTVESLTSVPLPADRAAAGAGLPWRLARTMKEDHVAAVAFLRWPGPASGWYLDLRRVASYSPVVARWVTMGDFFHLSDRPWDLLRPKLDDYVMPYLEQAVARGDRSPISGRVRHAAGRARLDALIWTGALLQALDPTAGAGGSSEGDSPESLLERGEGPAAEAIEGWLADESTAVARLILGPKPEGASRPGYLILNPIGVARRCPVVLPEAAPSVTHEGPLRIAQFTEEGVQAVVDLPAFGFAWVPREPDPERFEEVTRTVFSSGKLMGNGLVEAEIDESTGGLRGVRAPGEAVARVAQQLAVVGLIGPDGQPASSVMKAESVEVEYGGPALAQAVSRGVLLRPGSDAPIARFRQRVRLWEGRSTIDLDITLDEVDPEWQARIARADPWGNYLACRWAWPLASASLWRTSLLGTTSTNADRPETPDAFEIVARHEKTTLLFCGLAHHRRQGGRMLDTILVAGREGARTFRLGVALDLEHASQGIQDFRSPAVVVPVEWGPPRLGPAGWFFHIDRPNVAVTRVEYADRLGESGNAGLVVHLLEVGGRASRCRFRLFRDPTWARQTDFQGDLIVDLPIEGDAVLVDLTPHELARIEVLLD